MKLESERDPDRHLRDYKMDKDLLFSTVNEVYKKQTGQERDRKKFFKDFYIDAKKTFTKETVPKKYFYHERKNKEGVDRLFYNMILRNKYFDLMRIAKMADYMNAMSEESAAKEPPLIDYKKDRKEEKIEKIRTELQQIRENSDRKSSVNMLVY